MLIEIGLVIATYCVARLLPDRLSKLRTVASGCALLVAGLTVVDLTYRGFFERSLIQQLLSKAPATSEKESAPQSSVASAPKSKPNIRKADGGSIRTELGYGIAVAKGSSLHREWIAIDYPEMPLTFEGTPGVSTSYESRSYGGDYHYVAKITINATADISAYELRFLTFDVWGNHVRTLSFTNVEDIASGTKKTLDGQWNVYTENEVEEHYASIAFVAKVRLKDGRVVAAPLDAVLDEARKFSAKFAEKDLEPAAPVKGP